MIGKPYSGKPNVRFDEGELETELLATTPALYSNVTHNLSHLSKTIALTSPINPHIMPSKFRPSVAILSELDYKCFIDSRQMPRKNIGGG